MAEEQNTDLTTEIEGQDHGVRLPPDPATVSYTHLTLPTKA